MYELLLIPIMTAVFLFGLFVMVRVGDFIDRNQRLIEAESRNAQIPVRIAAESQSILGMVSERLEDCSTAYPHMELFLSSAEADIIIKQLADERIDIVLMSDENTVKLNEGYKTARIITKKNASAAGDGMSEPDQAINVVWKKDLKSKNRDRVILALENGDLL